MGSGNSRVLEIENFQDQLAKCELLNQKSKYGRNKDDQIYGDMHFVRYKGMQFFLGESKNSKHPHACSLHYLVQPNLLLIPQYQLLQEIQLPSLQKLLQIISGVAQMGVKGGQIGIGYSRIGYVGRWGVVGQKSIDWPYRQILVEGIVDGVFFSPQLMLSLSQKRSIPKHDPIKSDVFSLGVILIQSIFQDSLAEIYDFQHFELHLKPLLEKLTLIRTNFGQPIYQLFIGMLDIQQEDRFDFQQLYQAVESIRQPKMLSSYMTTSSNSKNLQNSRQRASRSPVRNKTPRNNGSSYRNDVSPFRARFANNAKVPTRLGKTPQRGRVVSQRQQMSNKSPLHRQLIINTKFDQQNNFGSRVPKQMILYQGGSGYQKGMYSPLSRR